MGLYKRSSYVRKAKRGAVRAVKKAVVKRYGGTKSRPLNMVRIAKDVAKMAAMVNAEKKYTNQTLVTFDAGQVNINATGALIEDITPLMAEGFTETTRNGISIKLHSQFFQLQLVQLPNGNVSNTLFFELWYNNGMTMDKGVALTSIYQPSIFSGVIDTTSTREPNHMNDFTLYYKKRIYLPADALSGVNSTKTLSIPIKINKGKGRHIRYTGSGSTNYLTDIQNGQMFILIRCENGNANSATASTLPVAITGVNTGIKMRASWKQWYYDN